MPGLFVRRQGLDHREPASQRSPKFEVWFDKRYHETNKQIRNVRDHQFENMADETRADLKKERKRSSSKKKADHDE